jgi:hypothetical protein
MVFLGASGHFRLFIEDGIFCPKVRNDRLRIGGVFHRKGVKAPSSEKIPLRLGASAVKQCSPPIVPVAHVSPLSG